MECAYEGSGRKKLRRWGGLGAVTIKSGLQSVPFDPPAHHLEETLGGTVEQPVSGPILDTTPASGSPLARSCG